MRHAPLPALLALLLGVTGTAFAHSPRDPELAPELAPLPAPLRGLRVQLHETLAPQLVVENPTRALLEIEDAEGRVFLRIGAGGVHADLGALAWYQSYLPHGIARPRELRADAPPRWVVMRREPSWGWFDPRLQPPSAVKSGDEWRIPVRLAGIRHTLRGHFQARARPHGAFESRLVSPVELAPGVRVQLVPGQPAALLLHNASHEAVTVLGRQQEPVIRIAPQGVSVNLLSATWRDFGRGLGTLNEAALTSGGTDPVHWQHVSSTPRYSWIEPRSAYPESEPPQAIVRDGRRVTVRNWQVPVLVGNRRVTITGVTDWVPLPREAR